MGSEDGHGAEDANKVVYEDAAGDGAQEAKGVPRWWGRELFRPRANVPADASHTMRYDTDV
jgi:hypothetical protein